MAFGRLTLAFLILALVFCINASKDKNKNKNKNKDQDSECMKNCQEDYKLCKGFCKEMRSPHQKKWCFKDCKIFLQMGKQECKAKSEN